MFRRRKQNSEQDRGLVAKLRQGIGALLENPTVRREARRGADRLANDPRVRRKVRGWADRAAQRFRR